jgi:hypothetical protein
MSGEKNLHKSFGKNILCLLFGLILVGCVPTTAPEAQSGESVSVLPTESDVGIYSSDCLGREIETPENAGIVELSTSLTPLETQITESDLIVVGTITDISGTCYNQDGGEYYSNGLPYFEVRLTVDDYLQQRLGIDTPELVLTAVGYGLSPHSEWPFAVGDQVLAFVVDRELAWRGTSGRPILRPFDDPTSSFLLAQPDGSFASVGGYHAPLTLAAVRAQLRAQSEPAESVPGCAAGGAGVFTPEDVRCYLDSFQAEFVQEIDGETAVLFSDPTSIADWVGGAVIYHIPSVSSLVLDRFGDVNPQFSHITNRAALVAYSQLAANPGLMADLKQTVQQNWQTTDSGQPAVRLGLAWQDGSNSVFLLSIAGLPAADDRFFCPSQAWTIGDEEIVVIADCIVQDTAMLVPHFMFTNREVQGSEPQPVQVALDGVASNELLVAEGDVALETAVYQAAIFHRTQRDAVVQQNTTTDLFNPGVALGAAVDETLLQTFVTVSQNELALNYLFLNSDSLFLHPRDLIERDYLPATGGLPDCDRFRLEYPGLGGGIITLSQIGFSADGRTAVLFLQQECGETAVYSSYMLLQQQANGWAVVGEFGQLAPDEVALPEPSLVYSGSNKGCGDIFAYKANNDEALSEFLTLFIPARDFALSAEPLTLDLANYREVITVKIDLFGDRVYNFGEFPYCNDVGPEARPQSVWLAESGMLTISINGTVPPESCNGDGYEATIRLENVLFTNGAETVQLGEALFENVFVGWCAG